MARVLRAVMLTLSRMSTVPVEPYGVTQIGPEELLGDLAIENGRDVVIIRPSLVCESRVRVDFWSIMHEFDQEIQLPFGMIDNPCCFVA